MDIGNLFQLQRAFERDGKMHPAAKEEKIRGAVQIAPQRLVRRVVRQHRLHLAGKAQQFLNQAARRALIQAAVRLAKVHGQYE